MPPLKQYEFVHSLYESVKITIEAYSIVGAVIMLSKISQDSYKLLEKK
jgi:hypothetical protein